MSPFDNIDYEESRGEFQEFNNNKASPLFELLLLGGTVMLGLIIGVVLIMLYGMLHGLEVEELVGNLTATSGPGDRDKVRISTSINHLTMFVIPGLMVAIFIYKSDWAKALNLNKVASFQNIFLGLLLMLCSFPLVQFIYWFNQQLPLPEWMLSMEEGTAEMISNLLIVDRPYELIFNVFVIAVLPAIGEEIIFRGILQRNLQRLVNNPHIAVWMAAFIFSAIHLQFQGFLPRMILGAVLGYLYVWSGNLWIPILAHFANNALQVVLQSLVNMGEIDVDLENTDEVSFPLTLVSMILMGLVSYLIIRHNNRKIKPIA